MSPVADGPSALDEMLAAADEVGGSLPARPDMTGSVAVVVGTAAGTLVWEDGRVVSTSPGATEDATVTFTLRPDDAAAVLEGRLEPSVAFMRGRMKTAGDNGLVLAVLGATEGEPLDRWRAALLDRAPSPGGP